MRRPLLLMCGSVCACRYHALAWRAVTSLCFYKKLEFTKQLANGGITASVAGPTFLEDDPSGDGRVGLSLVVHPISCCSRHRPPNFQSPFSRRDLPAGRANPEG